MVEQDRVDDVLQRIGLASLTYYPEIHSEEPEYAVSDDVEWCLEPLSALPSSALDRLRSVVAHTIVDPTVHRGDVFAALQALVTED
jgi:hypothetical protein